MLLSGTARYERRGRKLKNYLSTLNRTLDRLPKPPADPKPEPTITTKPKDTDMPQPHSYPPHASSHGQAQTSAQAPRLAAVVNGSPAPAIDESKLTFHVKLYLVGRGKTNQGLAVMIQDQVTKRIGKHKISRVQLDDHGHLVLFFGLTGAEASQRKGSDNLRYTFKKTDVHFEYAQGFEQTLIPVRMNGETLVSTKPLPDHILTGAKREGYSLDDGAELKKMFNAWLKWAADKGHDPSVRYERGQIALSVTRKLASEL